MMFDVRVFCFLNGQLKHRFLVQHATKSELSALVLYLTCQGLTVCYEWKERHEPILF
jgi:hypothetical protein